MRPRTIINESTAGTCGSFYSTLYHTWESIDYCEFDDDEPHWEHEGSIHTWH